MLNKLLFVVFNLAFLFSVNEYSSKEKYSKEDFEGYWYCESQNSCLFIQKKGYSFYQPEQMYFKYKIKGDHFVMIYKNHKVYFKIKRITSEELILVNSDFTSFMEAGPLHFKRVDECNSYYE